jgi:hypothetical protein
MVAVVSLNVQVVLSDLVRASRYILEIDGLVFVVLFL